jgi:hypothetical protein
MSCSPVWAAGCYGVTSVLALLLLPEKAPALAYTVLLGYYPLIRLFTERIADPWIRTAIRLSVFNAAAALTYFVFRSFFCSLIDPAGLPVYLLWITGNAAFLVYDYALGQMMLYYVRKLSGRFK